MANSFRERTSLDGVWRFWPDPDGRLDSAASDEPYISGAELAAALGAPRAIDVPGGWQSQFEDLRCSGGHAYYEREFDVPEAWPGRLVRLCFGAVDYDCSVWLNGDFIGRHEGGYLPFELDATAGLRYGAPNTVALRVIDPAPGDDAPFVFDEVPHGKQSWYGPVGGLWQSVWLEASSPMFVQRALVHADPATSLVTISTRLGAPAGGGGGGGGGGRGGGGGGGRGMGGDEVECSITSPDGLTVLSASDTLEAEQTILETSIEVPSPLLWDTDSPHLYGVTVSLARDGHGIDSWTDGFGFRSITTDDGKLLLNGRPLYVLGALDQDYYHVTQYTPPSDDLLRTQVLRAKELGLNLLRCHIKVPDPRYLQWADRLGMLVWAELPNWNILSEEAKRRAKETLAGMIQRDSNHPSIIIWTIINESWGIDLVGDASQRAWLSEMFDWIKNEDPTRLAVDNSACPINFHVKSDLNDYHFYKAIPDHAGEWSEATAELAARPENFYSPHGDAVRRGDEPLLVSEFGNWGLPDTANLLDEDGGAPWWFDTGGERTGGIVLPRGVKDRFAEWGLDAVFGSWAEFVAQSQDHQFDALKFEIEDMRSHPAIEGYVITELTDVNWECNGLLDLARTPKSYHHRFHEINAADVVFALPERRRYETGEHAELEVFVSHYSALDLDGCRVTWRMTGLELRSHLDGPKSLPRGEVASLGTIKLDVPAVEEPFRTVVDLGLEDGHGRAVNRNSVELWLWPASDPNVADTEVEVAERWDDGLDDRLRNGGKAVVVATTDDALPRGLGIELQARRGTQWSGDWAQGMGWLDPRITRGLPLRPRIDFAFDGLTPDHLVTGYEPSERADVLAAYYLGWIHSTAAAIASFRHGQGAGIICTLPLLAARGDDPLASVLLERLIEQVADPGFHPAKTIRPRPIRDVNP